MVSIEERVEKWVQLGVPCEHRGSGGGRDCEEPAVGGVIYDSGLDNDAVLSCGGHLVEIRKRVVSDIGQRTSGN